MTKTLTEQWREGTLPDGEYYVKTTRYKDVKWYLAMAGVLWYDMYNPIYKDEVVEVLAPVPSYEENNDLVTKCHQFEKQLAEANILIGIMCPQMENETLQKCIEYAKKWGVK